MPAAAEHGQVERGALSSSSAATASSTAPTSAQAFALERVASPPSSTAPSLAGMIKILLEDSLAVTRKGSK
jgi:hypothetical protein